MFVKLVSVIVGLALRAKLIEDFKLTDQQIDNAVKQKQKIFAQDVYRQDGRDLLLKEYSQSPVAFDSSKLMA